MSDAITKRDGDWVKSWIDGAREAARGAVTKAGSSKAGPYLRTGGSTVIQVGEGIAVGALLGASKVRFGVDASPGLVGAAALLALATADVSPVLSAHAANMAGQAAAVMADRRTQSFLGGWMGGGAKAVEGPSAMTPIGPAAQGPGGGDRILQTAARIAARRQAQ